MSEGFPPHPWDDPYYPGRDPVYPSNPYTNPNDYRTREDYQETLGYDYRQEQRRQMDEARGSYGTSRDVPDSSFARKMGGLRERDWLELLTTEEQAEHRGATDRHYAEDLLIEGAQLTLREHFRTALIATSPYRTAEGLMAAKLSSALENMLSSQEYSSAQRRELHLNAAFHRYLIERKPPTFKEIMQDKESGGGHLLDYRTHPGYQVCRKYVPGFRAYFGEAYLDASIRLTQGNADQRMALIGIDAYMLKWLEVR